MISILPIYPNGFVWFPGTDVRVPLKIHFGGQRNLFAPGGVRQKPLYCSNKADLSSLPENKNLHFTAQKQLLEPPIRCKSKKKKLTFWGYISLFLFQRTSTPPFCGAADLLSIVKSRPLHGSRPLQRAGYTAGFFSPIPGLCDPIPHQLDD